jgi:hypothetical protein
MQHERIAVTRLLKEALREGRARHTIQARKLLQEGLARPWRPQHRAELESALERLGVDSCKAKEATLGTLADVAEMHNYQRCLFSTPGFGGSNGTYLTNGQLEAIARTQ